MNKINLIDFPKKSNPSYQASFGDIKYRFSIKDFYDNYLKACIIKNKEPEFIFAEYKKFIEAFNKSFIDHIINTGKLYVLPEKLGVLGVLKKKSKAKVPNWKKWKEEGIYEYYDNSHTDGYKCCIYHLLAKEQKEKHNTKYRYKSLRYTSRRTAKLLKENDRLIHKYQAYDDYNDVFSLNVFQTNNAEEINVRRDYKTNDSYTKWKFAKYYESINKNYNKN